jgi:HD-like signal output (HDOD) protein
MAGVMDIVKDVEQLPAFPAVIARAAAVLTNPHATLADAEKIVRQDEALSSAILRLGNSARYGISGRTLNIQQSLARIGRNAAMTLVMNMKLSGYMERAGEAYGLRRRALWHGSLFGAACAEQIAIRMHNCDPGEAYLCALMRDIGKLAVDCHAHVAHVGPPDDWNAREQSGEVTPYVDLERDALGADHAEIGAALAEKWGLPEPLPDAIRYHHQPPSPGDPKHHALFDTVHAADILCLATGLGVGNDGLRYRIAPHVRASILSSHHAAAEFTAAAWSALAGIDPEFSRTGTMEPGA